MAGTPWNKGLTKADSRIAAAEKKRRASRIYYSPYTESGRVARNRRSKQRRQLRDPLYIRSEFAFRRARQAGVHRGILKKCVNGQAVYPLSEQDGLKAQERRYTAYGKEKH